MRTGWLLVITALWTCLLAIAEPTGAGADVLNRAKARGYLISAAVPDQLPLAARGRSGELEGFDIDVAEAIGRQLKLPVRFVTPGWDEILAGRWQERWDLAVASITPAAERRRSIAFPAVYRLDAAVVVAAKDDPTIARVEDASHASIAVKAGTTFLDYLRHDLVLEGTPRLNFRITGPVILPFADTNGALEAVARGRADAAVTSQAAAAGAIKNGAALRIVPDFLYFEPVAVAIEPGDERFAATIAAAIAAIRKDGTLGRLSQTWFGLDVTGLSK